jgi:hypothetical protein
MRINLRVDFTNKESKEITCSARDLVAFEEKFNRSVAKLESEFRLTDLLFLAWHSEQRRKETKKGFDEWLDDVEQVNVGETDPK